MVILMATSLQHFMIITGTYFISSSETAFKMKMLSKFDAEVLLGQISYKQVVDLKLLT